MKQNIQKKNNLFFYVFTTICLFLYIYQFNLMFLGLPVINSSAQLSWILMVLYAFAVTFIGGNRFHFKSFSTYSYWKKHIRYYVFLFVYSLFLIVYVGLGKGSTLSGELLKIFIYGIPMFWIWSKMFDNIDEFMKILLITGVIQTVIIFYCLINPAFAIILDKTVNFDPSVEHHLAEDLRGGYAGGIGCISSFGLIKYTLTGLIPCAYFCAKKEGIFYLVVFMVMAFCASMIARTGLIYDVILAIYIFFKRLGRGSVAAVFIVIFLTIIVVRLFLDTPTNRDIVEERFHRYEQLTDDNSPSFFELYFYGRDTQYPPINSDTFLGVGITSGTSANGYVVNVDGGPMRQYSAIGILGCLLFYFLVIRNQVKTIKLIQNKDSRHLLWLLFLCLIIGEWKETTYMALWPLTLFFFLCYLFQMKETAKKY